MAAVLCCVQDKFLISTLGRLDPAVALLCNALWMVLVFAVIRAAALHTQVIAAFTWIFRLHFGGSLLCCLPLASRCSFYFPVRAKQLCLDILDSASASHFSDRKLEEGKWRDNPAFVTRFQKRLRSSQFSCHPI